MSHTSSPRSSVVTWSRWKPSLSRTRNDGAFQGRTDDHSRFRPVTALGGELHTGPMTDDHGWVVRALFPAH